MIRQSQDTGCAVVQSMVLTETDIALFWSKVHKSEDGCWRWMGSICETGKPYGRIMFRGTRIKTHRLSYMLHFGDIPEGMFICHRCDNPRCVNPAHLFVGTPNDNIQDMMQKGRQRHPRGDDSFSRKHPERLARGERGGTAKLTTAQVLEIRSRYKSNGGAKALASEYKVSIPLIEKIVAGKVWKHLL